MWVLETVAVAFGMYSALPVPHIEWNEKNMRYALVAFPLVGAVLGLAWWGACALCKLLALPTILRGAILCVLPALVTGGIHLDGYADTSDALASHAAPERKQEILRDPHCGAFAVIRLCVYFVAFFALCCVLEPTDETLWCAGFGFVLSRALSGLALAALPIAEGSSLARTFADTADKRRTSAILAAVTGACIAGLYLHGGRAIFLVETCVLLVVAIHYADTARRQFGGLSGDLAGWFLVKTEFWALAALVVTPYAERML
ncbi:MAG: adenosylcobinamide-GDP ribazoletransferase [Ruminococcaceae bacterium]|nr:adenosylcobinamide-GDP ribazoletransferase [Oscillospiraceae bacterium]